MASLYSAESRDPKRAVRPRSRACYDVAAMGIREAAALAVTLLLCGYARSRLPKGEWTWSVIGYGYQRPMTAWGVVYVLTALVLAVWALRVGHLVFYGPD